MNKIKLIYDVVMTMKKKETIKGSLKVEGKKDQVEFLRLENVFEKNLVSGDVKAKITTDIEAQGNKVKHQSSTEFNLKNCHDGVGHGPARPWHHHGAKRCGGFKNKLEKLAFILKLIDDLQIEEQPDKTLLLSINLNEVPEVLKKSVHGGHDQEMFKEHYGHHCCIKELSTIEKASIAVTIMINKDKEVEKVEFIVAGKQNAEDNSIHELNLLGELQLNG
ncbi:MAG: hypothetical protein ACYDEJ_10975 [Desulfitobacteriaceae bacterium]